MTHSVTPQTKTAPAPFDDDVIGRSLLIEERHETRLARWAITLCVAAVGAFLVWASVTPVHEAVTGTGTLMPSGHLRTVQHLEGGIVEALPVSAGDRVEKGAVLVRLDPTQVRSEIEKGAARLSQLDHSIARLRALVGGAATLPADGPDELWESQNAALAGARSHIESQLQLIASERASLESQRPTLVRQRRAAEKELAFVRDILRQQQRSLDRGLSTRFGRDSATRDALELERILAEIEGAEARIAPDLAELAAREAELRSGWRRDAFDEIAALEGDREETRALLRQLQDRLARLDIVSPATGRVNVLAVEGPREVIAPGQMVAEIVPEGSEVYARIEIPASGIGGIGPGMDATLKVLTYDYTRFGQIPAVVDHVSPGSILTDEGEEVFEVRLRLDAPHLGPVEAGHPALPGMTVTADIVTGTRTLMSYLLKPIRVLQDRAFS